MMDWFDHLRIRTKLSFAPALAWIGMVMLAAGTAAVLEELRSNFRSLDDEVFHGYRLAEEIGRDFRDARSGLYHLIATAATAADTAPERIAELTGTLDALERTRTGLAGSLHDAALVETLEQEMSAYTTAARTVLRTARTDPGAALTMMRDVEQADAALDRRLDALVAAADANRRHTVLTSLTRIDTALAGLVAAILLGAVLIVLVTRGIGAALTRPLAALAAIIARLAAGETEVEVVGTGRRDELGAVARAVLLFRETAAERERRHRRQLDQEQAASERRRTILDMAAGIDGEVGRTVAEVARQTGVLERIAADLTGIAGGMTGDTTGDLAEEVKATAERLNETVRNLGTALTRTVRTSTEDADRRQHRRYDCALPACVTGSFGLADAVVSDISVGGLQITGAMDARMNDEIFIDVASAGRSLRGRVVGISQQGVHVRFNVALEGPDLNEDLIQAIAASSQRRDEPAAA